MIITVKSKIASDPSFIHKAYKSTCGRGKYWSEHCKIKKLSKNYWIIVKLHLKI